MKFLKQNNLVACMQCVRNRSGSAKIATSCITSIQQVIKHDTKYGTHTDYFGKLPKKKIIVEFSSPNIAKQFHVGHYRSTVIGHVISNLLQSAGHDVVRMNYLGDWGLQFAYVFLGCTTRFRAESYKEKLLTVADMNEAYVNGCSKFDKNEALEVFDRMERNDPLLLAFWSHCRDLSVAEYEKFYSRLGVRFDEYSGESLYRDSAEVLAERYEGLVERGEGKSLQVDVSNSEWVKGAKRHPGKISLSRPNGTSLYITRDMMAAVERYKKFKFDEMIYVTDSSQKSHFSNLFAAMEALKHDFASFEHQQLKHVSFGRVRGMKSREGKAQLIEETIEEVRSHHKNERSLHGTRKDLGDATDVCEVLALTSLACHDLDRKLERDYQFKWDRVLNTKGHSGLFLQYTHCRLHSLIQNCGVKLNFNARLSKLEGTEIIKLSSVIGRFGSAVEKCHENLQPCVLVHYLFELSHEIASALNKCPVKRNENGEEAQSYLLAFYAAKVTLGNGLKILGIEPLDEM